MRDRIIRASIENLRREGLKFSVDTLTAQLKISKKTVYKYFPDKEALAVAIYEKYYADAAEQAKKLAAEGPASRHALLALYYDAKIMTRGEIFNKYMLNQTLLAYTAERNHALWETLCTSFGQRSPEELAALRIIVDGSLEKLCGSGAAAEPVIEKLVDFLW